MLVMIFTTLYYLFVTQTGIFEFSFAKGRAGWNILLLVPIVIILHFSNFIFKLNTKFLVVIASLSFTTSLVFPPTAYRIESDKALYAIKNLVSGREVNLYSDFSEAKFIGSNIIMISKEELSYDLNSNYVLLNISSILPDLFKANIRRYEDRDFNTFYENQSNIINTKLKNHDIFIEQLKKLGYKVVLKESEFIILKGEMT
jgi:glycosyltransferase involved in cell wall biosynthesis